jgi:hypothetical protein
MERDPVSITSCFVKHYKTMDNAQKIETYSTVIVITGIQNNLWDIINSGNYEAAIFYISVQ